MDSTIREVSPQTQEGLRRILVGLHETDDEWFRRMKKWVMLLLTGLDNGTPSPVGASTGLEESAHPGVLGTQGVGILPMEAFDPRLRGLQRVSHAVLVEDRAVVFAGEAVAGAAVFQAATEALEAPRPVPYAIVLTPAEAQVLVAAGLPEAQVIGAVFGATQVAQVEEYRALGITETIVAAADTVEVARAQADVWARQANIDPRFFGGRHVTVITTRAEATDFLQSLAGALRYPDGRPLESTALSTAYDALQRYL